MDAKLFNSLPNNARLTLKEVASIMGISHSALTSRMNRAGIGKNCELFTTTKVHAAGGVLMSDKIMIQKSNVQKFIKLMALIAKAEEVKS